METRHKTRDWFTEGCRLMRTGKLSEALDAFSAAIDGHANVAEAYFRRGVCGYLLGHYRMATDDVRAAALLGCRDAQMWGRYDLRRLDDTAGDASSRLRKTAGGRSSSDKLE